MPQKCRNKCTKTHGKNVPSRAKIMFKKKKSQMPVTSKRGEEIEACSQDGILYSYEEDANNTHSNRD